MKRPATSWELPRGSLCSFRDQRDPAHPRGAASRGQSSRLNCTEPNSQDDGIPIERPCRVNGTIAVVQHETRRADPARVRAMIPNRILSRGRIATADAPPVNNTLRESAEPLCRASAGAKIDGSRRNILSAFSVIRSARRKISLSEGSPIFDRDCSTFRNLPA